MYIRTEHRSMYLPWNIASESQSPEVSPLINQQAFANRPTEVQLLQPIASLLSSTSWSWLDASARPVAKKVQGSIPAKTNQHLRRHSIGRQLGDTAEHDCENQRGQERPYQSPRYADHRLLVTNSEITPSKRHEQFTVVP